MASAALRDGGRLVGLAVLVSLASAAAFIGVAAWLGSAWWSAVAAAVTLIVLGSGLAWLLSRRRRLIGVWAAALMLLAALVSLSWLWPGFGRAQLEPVPGMTRLSLPDGTELAVHITRSSTPQPTREPLIVVHGGPGVADMAHDAPIFARLATDRDVYVYDQIGVGASTRLVDPAGYTLTRAIEDLEAVRSMTGARRVALLGHSWGASVATGYLGQHPERVAALVLSAPAALPGPDGTLPPGNPAARLDGGDRLLLYLRLAWPRNLFAYGLAAADPQVAHAIAGDEEMDRRFTGIYGQTTPALFCDPRLSDRLGTSGVGFYANQIPQLHPQDARPLIDPAQLARLSLPVLVLKPGCDYIPWAQTVAYRDPFPQARLVLLPDAGHQAYLERPDAYLGLVAAFLAGQDLPLPTVTGDAVPEAYQGVR